MPGYIDVLFYDILTAVSFTFIDQLDNKINPFLSLLFMACVASLFFLLVNYKNLMKIWNGCTQYFVLFVLINIMIGVNWLCSIFAPNKADPFVYLAVSFITMAAMGVLYQEKRTRMSLILSYLECGVLLGLILFIYYEYYMAYGRSTLAGVILGVIAGVSGYCYGFFSGQMMKIANLTVTQVLSARFIVLILGLFIITYHQGLSLIKLSLNDVLTLLFMSFFSLIVPIFFMLSAIKKLGINQSSLLFGFIPLLTFIIYSIYHHQFIMVNFIIALVITLVLIFVKVMPFLVNKEN